MRNPRSATLPFAFLVLAAAVCVASCFDGSDSDEPSLGEAVRGARQAARSAGSVIEEMQTRAEQPPADPVDFRNLRELLPERLGGLSRVEAKGERMQMMGMGVSQASAEYGPVDGQDRRSLQVEIQDVGGLQIVSAFGLPWLLAEFDRETDRGYERTGEIEGYRGYEEYDRDPRSDRSRGELTVLVADRFLVKVSGQYLDMDTIKQALRGIDLDALEEMSDEGR